MHPSATKEQQPLTNTANIGESSYQLTHTENFDHELVTNAKAELGEGVEVPTKNLGPIQNEDAMRHLLEVVNEVKDAPKESLIGEAGVRKDLPEMPQQRAEPFPNKVISAINKLREGVYHGYLKRGSRIRFNKSKDNLVKLKERSELLGQKLKVDEVMHVPKKVELPPEQPEVIEGEVIKSELNTPVVAPQQVTEAALITPTTAEQTAQPTPSAVPSESIEATAQPTSDKAPADLNVYRQTGQIVPGSEQPQQQVQEAPPVTQSQAA
jgi:hypothetical protein